MNKVTSIKLRETQALTTFVKASLLINIAYISANNTS